MKYKLIKEYPGSPKLGTIAEKSGDIRYTYPNGVIRYESNSTKSLFDNIISYNPEYWEEVVEKNYEIISWYFGDRNITKNPDGSAREYFINSVKRLSDGEIFTVGNKCKDINTNCITNVSEITLKNTICFINGVNINYLEKVKQHLFTTEDGVDIYEGDKISTVLLDPIKLFTINGLVGKSTTPAKGFKYFSTKEKAEEYIIRNKPCLSLNDVAEIYKTANLSMSEYNSKKDKNQNHDQGVKLIDLVKEKLNMK